MAYELSKQEKREIKDSTRSWDGRRMPTELERIIKKYGINQDLTNKGHYEFSLNGKMIYFSGTSGDWRAGRNLGKKLIDFIEDNYKERVST